MRVKKAKKVNIRGAQITSYSSSSEMMLKGCDYISNGLSGCHLADNHKAACIGGHTLSFDFSLSGTCIVGGAEASCLVATFLLRSSSACASAPVAWAVDAIVGSGFSVYD